MYSLSLEKKDDPDLCCLIHTKSQLIHQNVTMQVQILLADQYDCAFIKVYFYRILSE